MLILDATTKSLQFKLGAAVATNQLPFSASYVNSTGTTTTPGEQDGISNGPTAVTAVSSPASSTQTLLKSLVIQNVDTAAATVTIIYNNNSTLRNIVVATLAVGDQLIYEDGNGWSTVDKNGNLKTSTGVSSVSNTDGTLTISPVNGSVVASLAALASGKILVGNGSSIATGVAMSGDATLSNTGAITVTKANGVALGAYATASTGQLPGTTTNDNASAGNIGEYVSSLVSTSSAVSLTSNSDTNITSISLTAGDWDVWGIASFKGGSTTTVIALQAEISTTSAGISGTPGQYGNVLPGGSTPFNGGNIFTVNCGPLRFSLSSSTTTIYLAACGIFGTSTCAAFGTLQARRVR